ncbi:hypothetical protein J4479_05820 [Candidatus Woesearchaeota archaeon]|nr:hypothetical protein [Candidatus Woesearchaeota archaeon]
MADDDVIKQNLQMKLRVSEEANKAISGDLGTFVKNGKLYIHPDTYEPLIKAGLYREHGTVLEFISSLQTFPTFIAQTLGWESPEQANQAYLLLADQLTGYFPEDILHFKPTKRGYGARDPNEN